MNPFVRTFSNRDSLLRFILFLSVGFGLNQTASVAQIYNYTNASSGAPASVAAHVTGTALTRGAGVFGTNLACTGLTEGFGATGWPTTNTFDANQFNNINFDYITLTLTPDVGYGMKITGFSTRSRRENVTGTADDGPIAMRYGYSTNGGATWTTVNPGNPQSSNICSSSGVLRAWPSFITINASTPVIFRIYGLSSGSAGTGDLVLHDVVVSGTVCANTPSVTPAPDYFTICEGETSFDFEYTSEEADTYTIDYDDTGITDESGAVPNAPGHITFHIPANTPPGTYTGTFTVSNTCGFNNDYGFTIEVLPLPEVTCPENEKVCVEAEPFALSGGLPAGGVYSGTGVSAGVFYPAVAGVGAHTITYTYTDENNCSNSCTYTIEVFGVTATVDAGADLMTCIDGVVHVSGTIGGTATTGTWTASLPGGSFSPNSTSLAAYYTPPPGNTLPITLTLTADDVCIVSDALVVTYGDLPPLTLNVTGPAEATCGDEVTFSVVAANGFNDISSLQYSVNWDETQLEYVSHTGTTIDASAPGVGTFNVAGGELTYLWLDMNGIEGEDLADGTSLLSVTFKVINNAGATIVDVTGTPTAIEAVNSQTCLLTVNTNEATITLHPIAVNCPDDQMVCLNTPPYALTGGDPDGGSFSGTGVSDGTFDPEEAGLGNHVITYTYTDENYCTNSCTLHVQVNPLPDAFASNTTICSGASTALTVTNPNGVAGSTFDWTASYGMVTGGAGSGNDVAFGANAINETLVNPTNAPIIVTYTLKPVGPDPTFCEGSFFDVFVTVEPAPIFGFTATVNGRPAQTGTNANGPSTITIDFCEGEYFCFSNYTSNAPNIGFIEQLTDGTQNNYYGATHIDIPRTPTPISYLAAPGYFSTCPPGGYGPYNIDPGTSGQIVQVYTPYLDLNSDGDFDEEVDCLGDPITLIYNIYAPPTGSADPGMETICSGGTTDIDLGSDVAGSTFSWVVFSTTGTVTGQANGNGDNIAQTISGAGTVTYRVTPIGPAPNFCPGSFFDVFVTVNPPVTASVLYDDLICEGGTVTFHFDETGYAPGTLFTVDADFTDDNGPHHVTFTNVADDDELTWTEGNEFEGDMSVTNLVVTHEGNLCTGTIPDFDISVNPPFSAYITGAVTVHAGAQIQLTGTDDITLPGVFDSGVWSSNSMLATVDGNGLVTGVAAGGPVTISYTVTDNAGCVSTAEHVINVLGPLTLTSNVIGSSMVACGSTVDVQVAVTNFTDIGSLNFSINWDPTKFDYVSATAPDINGSVALLNTSELALGHLGYLWGDDMDPFSSDLSNGTVILTYTLRAIGSTGSYNVVIGDLPLPRDAYNGEFSQVPVISTGVTIDIIPISLVPGPNPVICHGVTTTTLSFSGVVGSPNHYVIDYDGAAEMAGFPPMVSGTLDLMAGFIILNVPANLPHGVYHATLVVSNTANGCSSISYPIAIEVDQVPPTASSPAPISQACMPAPAPNPAVVTTEADNCPGPITVAWLNDSDNGGSGCGITPKVITRTYRVTDAAGNTTDVTQTITILDNVAPTVSTAGMATWYPDEASAVAAALAIANNTKQDNCTPPVGITVSLGTVPTYDGCKVTIHLLVKDACNNLANYNYVTTIDAEPPTIDTQVLGPIDDCYDVSEDPQHPYQYAIDAALAAVAAASNDDCTDPENLVITATTSGTECDLDITVTVADACGKTTSYTYNTRVENDPPIITSDADAMSGLCFETLAEAEAYAMSITVVGDDCTAPGDLQFDPFTDEGCPTSIMIVVTDYCGNASSITYTNVYIDDSGPYVGEEGQLTQTCFQTPDEAYAYLAEFTNPQDDCTATEDLVNSALEENNHSFTPDQEGALCDVGTVHLTFVDHCGHTLSVDYPGIILDDIDPEVVSFPVVDPLYTCIEDVPQPDPDGLVASDNCSESISVTWVKDDTLNTCPRNITRTYRLTDGCGNAVDVTQLIIVHDLVAPTWLSAEGDLDRTYQCSDEQPWAGFSEEPLVEDNCGEVTLIKTTGEFVPNPDCSEDHIRGTYTNTWVAVDQCGNVSETAFTQIITVVDTEYPLVNFGCQFMPPLVLTTSNGADCPADADISLEVGQVIHPNIGWSVAGIPIQNLSGCISDNCSAEGDINVTVVSIDHDDENLGCSRLITVSFEISDECGNVNPTLFVCQYQVIDNTAPVWETEAGALDAAISCSDQEAFDYLDGLAPVASDNCDEDLYIEKISGSFVQNGDCPSEGTITNTWTAYDDCENASLVYTQVISLFDNEPPTFNPQCQFMNLELSTYDGWDCPADATITGIEAGNTISIYDTWNVAGYQVPAIGESCVDDNCTSVGDIIVHVVSIDNQYDTESCSRTITVTLQFEDLCGNIQEEPFVCTYHIIDNVAPRVFCYQFLNNGGPVLPQSCYHSIAEAEADALESVYPCDECTAEEDLEVSVSTVLNTGDCNADVTVTVTDCAGNSDSYTFTTHIDGTGPVLTKGALANCFPTVTAAEAAAMAATTAVDNCPGGLSPSAVTSGLCPANITVTFTDGCGNSSSVVYENICIGSGSSVHITTQASNQTVDCANEASGLAAWLANHGGAVATGSGITWSYTPVSFSAPSCTTHMKAAVVKFYATDGCGYKDSTTATFFVQDLLPPTVGPIANTSLSCISGVPAPDLNLVTGVSDNCDASPTVALFSNSSNGGAGCPGNPLILLRTYSVTDDYCNTTYVTHTITIVDNVPPTFTAPPNITINVDANCNYNATPAATGDVTNEADNCSVGLNATYLETVAPGNGNQVKYVITRNWEVKDNCGNGTTLTQIITVKDVTAPTITCPNPVNVPGGVVENNSCAWAGAGLTPLYGDNCAGATLTYTLSGFFTGNSSGTGSADGRLFLEGQTTVTYTVTDAVGNTASCSFVVTVNCVTISGRIIWEHNHSAGVKDATVRLTQGMTLLGSTLSDLAGNYTLSTNTLGMQTITPVKNINRMNGVDANDATAIQQHIGGMVLITDPYKKVAADVNRSGFITTQDATLITQCIAGNPTALAVFNVFWRFVPTTYVMPVTPPATVPTFPPDITVNVTGADITGQDFYGMKIGDVNGTANPALAPAGSPLVWMLKDHMLQPGTEIELNFAASNFTDLAALQFGLDFDPSYLQFTGFESLDAIPMTADNFGAFQADLGELRVVWSQAQGVTLPEGTPVLKAKFKVVKGGRKLSDVIQLDDSAIPCKAYTEASVSSDIRVVFVESVSASDPLDFGKPQLRLFQNQPNPFAGETTIGFVLPEACDAQLRIMDVSGRELTNYNRSYTAGYHEIDFRMENAASYGVLYYELITPFGRLTKKMVTAGK